MAHDTSSTPRLGAGDRVCWIQKHSETGQRDVLREGTVHKVLGTFVEIATDGYYVHGWYQPGGVYGVTTGQIVLITSIEAGDQ